MTLVHVYVSENVLKIEKSFPIIFAKIWPITLYYMYVIENAIKNGGDFQAIFQNKAWAIGQGTFQKLARF